MSFEQMFIPKAQRQSPDAPEIQPRTYDGPVRLPMFEPPSPDEQLTQMLRKLLDEI